MRKANNQDEELMKEEFLTISIVTILIVVLITITFALYALNTFTSLILPLYVAACLIFAALVFYMGWKVTINGGGGKGK